MSDDSGFTPEERGQTSAGSRAVGRFVIVVAVAAASVAIVLGGNALATGRPLPWLSPADQPGSVLRPAAPSPSAAASETTPADLVEAEDRRMASLAGMASDDPRALAEFGTVFLAARDAPYGVADLLGVGALRQDDASTFTLVHNVVVRTGAQLSFAAPGATLRLRSGPGGAVSIVGWGGNVSLSGAEGAALTVIGWDEDAAVADTDTSDGRAYLRVRDAVLTASDVRFERLGYWSGRTGGVAATATDFGFASVDLTRTEHVGMHYGFFGASLSSGTLTATSVTDATMAGIALTNGTHDVAIASATVRGAGTDGIRIDRASSAVTVTGATVTASRGYGMRIDGRALADGPSPGGYATTSARAVSVIDSTLTGNSAGGLWMAGVDEGLIQDATVEATQTAVRVDGPVSALRIEGGTFTSTEYRGLVIADDARGVVVEGLAVSGPRVAIEARSSEVALTGSSLSVGVGHVVELGDGSRMDIVGNAFAGTGQDAVIALDGSRAVSRGNDASAWRFQFEFVAWMNDHPMMWMWAFVLVIPAIGVPLLARRRRRHRELRSLLEDAIIRYGRQQLEEYAAAEQEPEVPPAAPDAPRPAPVPPRPSAAPSRPAPPRPSGTPRPAAPPSRPPRSFDDLRQGALADREFETLQQFAVAAVLEAGYPLTTIARLFRVPSWRLETWVEETIAAGRPAGRRD